MRNNRTLPFSLLFLLVIAPSCKPEPSPIANFSSLTFTNSECAIMGAPDSTQWVNNVLEEPANASLLAFNDNIVIADTFIGPIQINPICPNPSDGFFIWNINPSQQCKLRLVCVNTDYEILYYNAYRLNSGPFTIAFDFRAVTAFQPDTFYRMYFGFYNGLDSLYFTGHGDFRIQ